MMRWVEKMRIAMPGRYPAPQHRAALTHYRVGLRHAVPTLFETAEQGVHE
jgi:hypothetical protein